ncbi:type III secretion system (T3SS) chaperone YscW [Isoptericola jiangsuensis]|uniref:Type III secretion system (T3SS) chaperone YscW n=1 Tax=Isoptericola jiangsuensis TaxID=548579 RepID=A0A2A9EU52_9MICO|nr:YbaY family lipoprotein [Isoptericola jiangsuensis]PFG41755.1 type III secretion system (T3SS) chaperone YscW [Isoptericola jiangsuensis]
MTGPDERPGHLSGTVELDRDVAPPDDGVVHVAVLDVTRADAASVEVAGVDVATGGGHRLPFELPDVPSRPGHRYVVRAHWDPRGDREVQAGDQLTVVSVPVEPAHGASGVRVPLRQV